MNYQVLFFETKEISANCATFLTALGVPLNIIRQHESTFNKDPNRVLLECLEYWFKSSESARTWEDVLLALIDSGHSDIAHKIKEKRCKRNVQEDGDYVAFSNQEEEDYSAYSMKRRPSILSDDIHAEITEKYSKASEMVVKFHMKVRQELRREKHLVNQKTEEFETNSSHETDELREQAMLLKSDIEKYEKALEKGLECIENKDYTLPSVVNIKPKAYSTLDDKYKTLQSRLKDFEGELSVDLSDSLYTPEMVANELRGMLKLKVSTEKSVCDEEEYAPVDELLRSSSK